jgi:hypothetical protein
MQHAPLSGASNFRWPDGAHDVRDFEVRTEEDERRVGRVADVILGGGRPRYLVIDAGGFFSARQILLPIGQALLDEQADVIWVRGLTKGQLKRMPEYVGDPGVITADYEMRLRGAFPANGHEQELYDYGRLYAPRARTLADAPDKAGEVDARIDGDDQSVRGRSRDLGDEARGSL